MQYTSKMALVAALASSALSACAEPYTTDPGAGQAPVVNDVILQESLGASSGLNTAEKNAIIRVWDGSSPVFPFSFVFVRFNKLMDGATIETTEKDEMTGRQIGNCGPVAGAITIEANGKPAGPYRTCYSPSDMLVSVQPAKEARSPFTAQPYLAYGVTYTVGLNSSIKDHEGKALTPYTAKFVVRPFELLRASSADRSKILWGAPGTALEPSPKDIKALAPAPADAKAGGAAGVSTVIRLIFSGPVDAPGLLGVKILDSNGTPVVAHDADNKAIDPTPVRIDPFANKFTALKDTRIIFIMPPQYVKSKGDAGLEVGSYTLVLPASVTDDGSVVGAEAPLGQEIKIPFKVALPEKK